MPGVQGLFTVLKHNEFTAGEKIGQGRFKKVCQGVLNLRHTQQTKDIVILRYARNAERREIELLSYLAKIPESRQFIPQIYGALDEFPDSLVLQERALLGSLKMALVEGSVADLFSPMHRLYVAIQISLAMTYIMSKRVVHGDLSCRNVLLFSLDVDDPSNLLVKVTDFGLAVLLPEGAQETTLKQPQAVRWCAPENIAFLVLSFATDAWSMGVTLWELFAGGASPWPSREKRAEVSAILKALAEGGWKPEVVQQALDGIKKGPTPEPWEHIEAEFPQAEDCPEAAHNIVLSCLRPKRSRASAGEVGNAFQRLVEVIQQEEEEVPSPPPAPEEDGEGEGVGSGAIPGRLPGSRRVFKSQALTTPESVEAVTHPDVLAFVDWLPTRRQHLYELMAKESHDPSGVAFKDVAHQGSRGVGRERWAELVFTLDYNYRGDTDVVFDVIANEAVGERNQASPAKLLPEASLEEVITLPQLKRFVQRSEAATATLTAGDEGSMASRFARHLRQVRGSVLRAWYSDIDCRRAGRVALVDFNNACRKFGYGAQSRLIWDCMRQDGGASPLEFHELAPDEAEPLEALAEVMMTRYGLNSNLAWQALDEKNQKYVSLPDFGAWLHKLGVSCNVKSVFRGLDSSGLGRLRKEDLEYLRKLVPKSRTFAQIPMPELSMWAKGTGEEPEELLASMGIPDSQVEITVNDLAARLTAVGFDGDSLQVSARAARSSGGARVSVKLLLKWLAGERLQPTDAAGNPLNTLRCLQRSPLQGSLTSLAMRKGPPKSSFELESGWNNSVDNTSAVNMRKCTAARRYFSAPRRMRSEQFDADVETVVELVEDEFLDNGALSDAEDRIDGGEDFVEVDCEVIAPAPVVSSSRKFASSRRNRDLCWR